MTNTQKEMIIAHSVEEILNTSMPCSIRQDLPSGLLEDVLAHLPPHLLCRFRLVCKEWNHLISQPSFAARFPHKASSIFISPTFRSGNFRTLLTEWQVHHSTEKSSYKLSDSFVMDSYLPSSWNRGLSDTCVDLVWTKYTVAAVGELIYTQYLPSDWPTTPRMHIVCNPVSKSFHEIPELPRIQKFVSHDIVVMSVDNATNTYKIVTLEMSLDTIEPGSRSLYLYESMTSAWRKLCQVPGSELSANSSIFMKGTLYTLFEVSTHTMPFLHEFFTVVLYSCDIVTGAWSKMDVDFPRLSFSNEHPQLVVCSDQLYMVKFTKHRARKVTVSIWKIELETKEVVKVAKIRNFWKLSIDMMFWMSKYCEMPVAVGRADSITISCTSRRRVKYDLLQNRWQELPSHTLDLGCSGILACLVDF